MANKRNIPGRPAFDKLHKARALPSKEHGVIASYPDNGVRLSLHPPGLLSGGGCLLIMLLILCGLFFYADVPGKYVATPNPWLGFLSIAGVCVFLIGGLLFTLTTTNKKVVIDIPGDKSFSITRRYFWGKRQEHYKAEDILTLGVHESKSRHDYTRLELIRKDDDKVELLCDWSFQTLCDVAVVIRTVLDIPKDTDYQAPDNQMWANGTAGPTDASRHVKSMPIEVVVDTASGARTYLLQQPSHKVAAGYLLAWLMCLAVSAGLGWWFYIGTGRNEEVDLFSCMYLAPAIWIQIMSAIAVVALPFAVVNALVADVRLILEASVLRYERLRLPAKHNRWSLNDIDSIELHTTSQYAGTHVYVNLKDGECETICKNYRLPKLLPVFRDIVARSKRHIKLRCIDRWKSFDG